MRSTVSRSVVAHQLGRLMGKSFPPVGQALEEVVVTVQRLAEDEAHVERIVTTLLAIPGNFPEPAAFSNAADSTATQTLMADPSCGKCGGCGFVHYTRGGTRVELGCLCHNPLIPGAPDRATCIVCGGTGRYEAVRGGEHFSEQCNCWARRPKSLRPWAMEGSYGA